MHKCKQHCLALLFSRDVWLSCMDGCVFLGRLVTLLLTACYRYHQSLPLPLQMFLGWQWHSNPGEWFQGYRPCRKWLTSAFQIQKVPTRLSTLLVHFLSH